MTERLDMILKDVTEALYEKETVRESTIIASRKVIRLSKNVIHAIHRGEDCSEYRKEMLYTVSSIDKDSSASFDALMEYAEAEILNAIINNVDIPSPCDLRIDEGLWLMGMADTIGELRRVVLTRLMESDLNSAKNLFEIMDELCEGLMIFDVPDAILPIRRKQDIARGILERTRSDLLNATLTFVNPK